MMRFFSDPIGVMRGLHQTYGSVAAVSDGDASLICAFGPENNQLVLSNPAMFRTIGELPFRVPPGSAMERVSTALVGMNGEQHRKCRTLMMSLFQKRAMERYRDDVAEVVRHTLDNWPVGQVLEVSSAMRELFLRISLRCLFGINDEQAVAELGRMAMHYIESAISPRLLLLPRAIPGTPYYSFSKLCERLEHRLRELIRERREQPAGRHDVLSTIIQGFDKDGASPDDTLLVGLTNELLIASHETSAYTMTWTLFLLSQHPRVLMELIEELDGELHGEAPTPAQLERLPLLDSVVKESMRLLSATPFLFIRASGSAFQLGPYELPAGSRVIVSPLITHHMPEVFEQPHRFLPERWRTRQPTQYEYLPLGAGPRLCLGASFAAQALRVSLALIVQRYRLELAPNADVSHCVRGIILGPRHGMPMRVEPQQRQPPVVRELRGNIHELVTLSG
jgi:cytochrome P450